MAIISIPIDSSPNQSFQVSLPFETTNRPIQFEVSFNDLSSYWVLNLFDPTEGVYLLTAVPLVPGLDILGQYQYLNLGHLFLLNTGDEFFREWPIRETLGAFWTLVWSD